MVFQRIGHGTVEDFFGARCVVHGARHHQDKLVGLQRRLILQYAVFGDAQAVQAGANRASYRRLPATELFLVILFVSLMCP